MTSILLFLVLRDDKVDAAFSHFEQAMKSMPVIEVQVLTKDKRRRDVVADMVVDGSKRMLFDAKTALGRFTLSDSPSGYREVDEASKSYDEYPYPGGIFVFESRISPIPSLIPSFLAARNLRFAVAKNAKNSFTGSRVVNGQTCDEIHSVLQQQMGTVTTDIDITPGGLVLRMTRQAESPQGRIQLEWDFSNYKTLRSVAQSRFENRIPDGYMPYSLPDHDNPVEVGKKPNLAGWVNPRSGSPWSPPKGRSLLFVVVQKGSLPCERAIGALARWRLELTAKGVTLAIASDADTVGQADGYLFDPDQRSLRSLEAPATPMFFLLDSGGTVRNLWMGFPQDGEGKMHGELTAALSALK